MSERILFVEDEADLALIVADTLRGQGYDVTIASDGITGLNMFRKEGADIVVADVMMPRMDGFSMAREIRRLSPATPLLFLTAKSTVEDVEKGFESGADDYLRKPFELRELIVRIKSLLRRRDIAVEQPQTGDRKLPIGAYTFDVGLQTLSFGGSETTLSHFEALILERLASSVGKTVDSTELMLSIWQRDESCNRNSLHGYIHKLRRALRHDPSITIVNQRGFGYMLTVRRRPDQDLQTPE